MRKEQTWKKLAEQIAAAGITVARNAKAVGAKNNPNGGRIQESI